MARTHKLVCPECGLYTTTKENTIRRHCRDTHQKMVFFMVKKTLEERRLAQYATEKKYCRKKQAAARMKLIASGRDDFTIVDADARGTHFASDSIVEYRLSVIPGSGCGVFARVGLREGDVVTRFEGEIVSATPTDPEYAIEF